MVGGVMATILKERIHEATGIEPFVGTLSSVGILDDNWIIMSLLHVSLIKLSRRLKGRIYEG